MNRIFVSLILTCLLSVSVAAEEESAVELRVLCYNIHYGQGMDGNYDIERLAKVINEFKPDIVALQEVDVGVKRSGRVHQIRELGKLTGMASRFGPAQHYQGGLYGNAILSKLPILDVAIHPLPYSASTPEIATYPRGCIAVSLTLPNGKPLRFISTHFQHSVEEDRVLEAKAINRLFFSGKEDPITILAGDLNAVPGSAPVKELQKHWTIAKTGELKPTAPSQKPHARIDYILHNSPKRIKTIEAGVIDEKIASDHLPVFAVIRFSPAD